MRRGSWDSTERWRATTIRQGTRARAHSHKKAWSTRRRPDGAADVGTWIRGLGSAADVLGLREIGGRGGAAVAGGAVGADVGAAVAVGAAVGVAVVVGAAGAVGAAVYAWPSVSSCACNCVRVACI